MSSSLTFLLMTSRMRWVPASGANVRPVDAHALDLVEQRLVEPVRAQARDPELDLASAQLRHQLLDQRVDARHVGGAERRQAGLAEAGLVDALEHRPHDRLRVALADRAVDDAGLAEAAALGAAAGDLDGRAVEDRLGVGHRELGRERELVEVADPHAGHRSRAPRRRSPAGVRPATTSMPVRSSRSTR
jgi:hypothetical protein